MNRRARGFTLLEVLIAVAIFAMVSAMAYAGLNNVLIARDRLETERAFWRALSLTYLRLEDDLAQARLRPVRDAYGITAPNALVVRPTDGRALGTPTLELTRGGVFVLDNYLPEAEDAGVRRAPKPPRSDLQRVAYRLHDGKLWRITWPHLDPAPQAQPTETELLADVEDFKVTVWDSERQRRDRWPPRDAGGNPTEPTALPRGAEVSLTLRGRGELTRVFLIHE
jgi:general secretion pathway protein J